MSLEDQQFTKWLRRPTEFIAATWYLMASAGQYVIGYAVVFLNLLLGFFGIHTNDAAFTHFTSTVAQIGLFFLPVVIYAVKHEGVGQSMRLNVPRWDALLFAILAAPIGAMISDKLSTWWMMLIESLGGSLHPSNLPPPTTLPELGLTLVLYALLPGICEEILFRGGLMGAWERRGTRLALVITSVLFALLHGNVQGLPVQLIMGFVLGYIVILSDSLFVGMAYHIAYNASTLIITYLSADSISLNDQFMTLTETVRGTIGFGGLIVQTVLWAVLFGGILALFIHFQKKRGAKIDQIIEGDKEPMGWETLLVLLAGLLTVGIIFMTDLLTVCGANWQTS